MSDHDVVIVGGGFTGLTAAFVLSSAGKRVRVLEADDAPGGLAGTFKFDDGVTVEKFYHHWFSNDAYVPKLLRDLKLEQDIVLRPSMTGMYFNRRVWKLSTPLDLLRFQPLSFVDRIRLGLLVFQVRRTKDWKSIEHLSIREWLEPLCGRNVYRAIWEPLITSKFSVFAESVNAVWMWKKLALRGGSRDSRGNEILAYLRGGFGRLAEALVESIRANGGEVSLGCRVDGVEVEGDRLTSVRTDRGVIKSERFLFTPALPIIASLFQDVAEPDWLAQLRRIPYLGNICLTLRLDRSLSDMYWLNVNDPGFPFVGVIEHTNFDAPENYKGSHLVYLSRYLSTEDPTWTYQDKDYFEFAFNHLKRMFPKLERSWIIDYKLWRAEFGQPVMERNYSQYIPGYETPYKNAWISTMAQIYPEDRGTNYAIREGRSIAGRMLERLGRAE